MRTARLSWANHTLRDELFWPSALFVLIFASIVLYKSDWLLRDQDTLWHITVGREILRDGALPWVDQFSHTFKGQPWIAKEWLSQVLLAIAYQTFHWKGVLALTAVAIAFSYSLLFSALASRMRLGPALIGTAIAYVLSIPHFAARPHILSYPFLVIWVMAIARAVDNRSVPSLLLLPIMTIWANLHAGFTLGLAIAAAFACEAIVGSDPLTRGTMLRRWGIFLGGALVASLITPYGPLALYNTYLLFGGNEALRLINEWAPFNFGEEPVLGKILMLALFASLYFGVKLPLFRAALTVFLIYMTLTHMRILSVLAIVVPILMATPLAQQFPYLSDGKGQELSKFVAIATRPISLIMITLCAIAILWHEMPTNPHPRNSVAPVSAVDYIEANQKHAKIFNEYLFGGYLIFRGIPTFIDGRTDQLFGGGFFKNMHAAMNGPKSEFVQLLDKYDITVALLVPKSRAAYRLAESDTWHLAYSDDDALVYERKVGSHIPSK